MPIISNGGEGREAEHGDKLTVKPPWPGPGSYEWQPCVYWPYPSHSPIPRRGRQGLWREIPVGKKSLDVSVMVITERTLPSLPIDDENQYYGNLIQPSVVALHIQMSWAWRKIPMTSLSDKLFLDEMCAFLGYLVGIRPLLTLPDDRIYHYKWTLLVSDSDLTIILVSWNLQWRDGVMKHVYSNRKPE